MNPIEHLTNEQLLTQYNEYEDIIYKCGVISVKDLIILNELEHELTLRDGA